MNHKKTDTKYTTSFVANITKGKLTGRGTNTITTLLLDSRKVSASGAEEALYFAIKGPYNDGHKFIDEMYRKGVRSFVVSSPPHSLKSYSSTGFIVVRNPVITLQQLAAYHRRRYKIPVIGITGSNGKTIVKEWLHSLLAPENRIVRSPKSFNSQVGVPLSVWQLEKGHQLAIFEAGISRPGEMEKLENIIQPTIGIFTNIGEAHSEGFENIAQKIDEKLKLFEKAETLIYCSNHAEIEKRIKAHPVLSRIKLISWGKDRPSDLIIKRTAIKEGTSMIEGIYNHKPVTISIPFTDDASVENAIHCWLYMLYSGYSNDEITKRMTTLSPVAMRLEQKQGINACTIINDSYNSDLGSLSIALDFLNRQKQHRKKTLILSDILQSGRDEKSLYEDVSRLIKQKDITNFIGIGDALRSQKKLFYGKSQFFRSTEEFLNTLKTEQFHNEAILIKGARRFHFEEISRRLEQKSHETVLEVNLNALVHNLNYLRSRLKPDTKVMAMVKAFSYGSGSFEIANVLQYHNVDYLAVAYADEGVELRKAGITVPIIVMNPEPKSFALLTRYRLEPEIYSMRMLNEFLSALEHVIGNQYSVFSNRLIQQAPSTEHRLPNTGYRIPFPIHLKIDTGMHRLGFENDDIRGLINTLNETKKVFVKSIFSHLVASEDKHHDTFTQQQIRIFKSLCTKILNGISNSGQPVWRHILNSAGVARFPEAQLEMVRLGIGLYGICHNAEETGKLQNVSALKTTISQIRNIPAGETVGYGRRGVARKAMTLATVAIGYADGLDRRLGNGQGKMFVNGTFVPTVGNVCMDMCMLDVTGINVSEGDQVVVFGEGNTISDIANDIGTIPYEVLTGISGRVKRVYYFE